MTTDRDAALQRLATCLDLPPELVPPGTLPTRNEQARAEAHAHAQRTLDRITADVCQDITPHVQEALRTSGVPNPESYYVTYDTQEIPHDL